MKLATRQGICLLKESEKHKFAVMWIQHFTLNYVSNNEQVQFSSVQFSRSVVSDSLRPHEPQHARPLCPSPTHRVYPNSCPSSQWCHPAISSSVIPFSSCPQTLPASGSFPMSQLFTSGGQILEFQLQHQSSGLISFRMNWLDLLAVQGMLKSLLQCHRSKASILRALSFLYSPTLTSIHD